MKWYQNMKLLAAILTGIMVVGTFAAVFAGRTKELREVTTFLTAMLGGGALGFTLARKGPQ